MRYTKFIFIAFLFYKTSLFAQQPFPVGVCNTYTLTEKEGYDGYNYPLVAKTKDGITYTINNNKLCAIGNNFSVCTDTIKNWGGLLTTLLPTDNNEVMICNTLYLAWFNKTRLISKLNLPHAIYYYITIGNKKVLMGEVNKNLIIYKLENKQIIQLPLAFNLYFDSLSFAKGEDGNIYLMQKQKNGGDLYKIDANSKVTFVKSILNKAPLFGLYFKNEHNGIVFEEHNGKRVLYDYSNNKLFLSKINKPSFNGFDVRITPFNSPHSILIKKSPSQYFSGIIKNNIAQSLQPFMYNDFMNAVFQLSNYDSWGSSGNKPFRLFPYFKKYPNLFNNTNSASIFSLQQDGEGKIWAGSYQCGVAVINSNTKKEIKNTGYQIMNGGSFWDNNKYLIGEGIGGLLKVNDEVKCTQVSPNILPTGYYTLLSKNKQVFYYSGTGTNIFYSNTNNLINGKPIWQKIDESSGNLVRNALTLTEDTLGRIWYGHPKRNLAVYNPTEKKATTWAIEKKETPFGAFSSLTDNNGTVWIGSGSNGLWYYNDYTKPALPSSFKKVNHPLLNNDKAITSLTTYKEWIVVANYDKVCLLHKDSLIKFGKLNVRYLNPQEANFTSFTEQNTMLTSKTDSSIWFSTSDMLYQWNIKEWLNRKWQHVQPFILITNGNKIDTIFNTTQNKFKAGFHSFDIKINYLSDDNLPRYLATALVKESDSVQLTPAALTDKFTFNNLAAGKYNFIVEVYEMDGTIQRYSYSILLKKFVYQQWWFWALVSFALLSTLFYLFNLKRKKQLAEQVAKTKDAELLTFKAEQEKLLANSKLQTLSSQFRPHFILNALNTIGADLDDKPEAESVLSRLGESVNLIFNHSRQQKILHPFENEWQLVQNVIHIHRLMYLKELQTILPNDSLLHSIKDCNIPLGLLQIPVENALLHGLSNKANAPWLLTINVAANECDIIIEIIDNGVGRKKSATLSNYTKHGTGTKNISDAISIINQFNNDKITVTYLDDAVEENNQLVGTKVIIVLPKNLKDGTTNA